MQLREIPKPLTIKSEANEVGTLTAIDESAPSTVISAALLSRFESRGNADYADQILSEMRK